MYYHALKEPIIYMENDPIQHVRGKDLIMARIIFSSREHFLNIEVLLSMGEVVSMLGN